MINQDDFIRANTMEYVEDLKVFREPQATTPSVWDEWIRTQKSSGGYFKSVGAHELSCRIRDKGLKMCILAI